MSDEKRAAEELRLEMTKLDGQLLGLVERRAKLAREVGKLRGDEVVQLPTDGRAALAALVARASGDLPPDSVRDIFREIHTSCLALELGLTIAFVGSAGSAGHAAARKRFGGPTRLVPCDTADEAARKVQAQQASFAVVPFETKADGLVQTTLTALVGSELKIVATFEASAEQTLVSRSGNLADVERIYTTPFDGSASKALLATLPRAQIIEVTSSEVACQNARGDAADAALANETFAASMDLVPCLGNAASELRAAMDERVRYAVLGVRPSGRTGTDATSVVFSVSDSPGALLEVLKQFAERGVNLTKIQSRPTAGEAWGYLFFVELVGHATDRTVVSALEDVKRQARFFKLLGSYAAG
jgi:chorismate mutase / prephenate dehydratase